MNLLRFLSVLLLGGTLLTCTDAVAPVYQFDDGFLLVEGRIADRPGFSEVRIARNELLFDNYLLLPVAGADVRSVADDGSEVIWIEVPDEEGVYRAPEDFVALPGREYFLRAQTPSGEIIESAREQVPTSVPIADARVRFQQEAYFAENRDRFIPAFDILVDVDDPAGEENFYQYNFTTFEQIRICATCMRARWRNGECIESPDTRFVTRWDYLCDAPCWFSNRAVGRNVMSDNFGDGNRIEDVLAGRFDWVRPAGVLFIVEQYNTSRESFEYNSVIEQLAEGGGGLNAPLPAALVGNLTDVSENNTGVLGFIGVTAVNEERIYINRDTIDGTSLPFDGIPRLEPVMPAPPEAPCTGGTRTTVRPEGWPQ